MVRKTFFDDCKGERIQELLVSFSTLVLRKVLAAGNDGRLSIAARLATAKSVTAKEQQSFLPLAVAHRASLTAVLRKKNELRERYKKFGVTLNAKEQELDRRFEAVISTQDFLDKNAIPDHTVARVSNLFEKNWQGDRKPVEVIMQGEEQGTTDALLDRPFSETWQRIHSGTFDGATGTSWQGLLQDLEERVANQEARLANWRNFKEAMQRNKNATATANDTTSIITRTRKDDLKIPKQKGFVGSPRKSPVNSDWKARQGTNVTSPTHPKPLRKESTQDELTERDMVFSPRKSPRKSMWPVENFQGETTPTHSQNQEIEGVATRDGNFDSIAVGPVQGQLFDAHEGDKAESSSRDSGVDDDMDESAFSEISDGQISSRRPQNQTLRTNESNPTQISYQDEGPSSPGNEQRETKKLETQSAETLSPPDQSHMHLIKNSNSISSDDDDDSWIPSVPVQDNQENDTDAQSANEEDKLAEQIISMTINAALTPAKPKGSLMERTRQSMAFASPIAPQNLLPEGRPSPTPFPPIALSQRPPPTSNPNGPQTLLERTRQSISLIPSSKPKGSRKSTLDRRSSKTYPTNQFETPKKHLGRVAERTPPEELFGAGAGYDSVFKSRPKIALSPIPSPSVDEGSETDGAEGEGGESPLARMTAKV